MSEKPCENDSPELLMIVRSKLLEIEEKCGIPRRRFAVEVLGVSDKTYYNVCMGTATLSLPTLDRMARRLGISVRVLVDADPMPETIAKPVVKGRPRKQQARRVGFEARRNGRSELEDARAG